MEIKSNVDKIENDNISHTSIEKLLVNTSFINEPITYNQENNNKMIDMKNSKIYKPIIPFVIHLNELNMILNYYLEDNYSDMYGNFVLLNNKDIENKINILKDEIEGLKHYILNIIISTIYNTLLLNGYNEDNYEMLVNDVNFLNYFMNIGNVKINIQSNVNDNFDITNKISSFVEEIFSFVEQKKAELIKQNNISNPINNLVEQVQDIKLLDKNITTTNFTKEQLSKHDKYIYNDNNKINIKNNISDVSIDDDFDMAIMLLSNKIKSNKLEQLNDIFTSLKPSLLPRVLNHSINGKTIKEYYDNFLYLNSY